MTKSAMYLHFEDLDQSVYQSDITSLEHNWEKCIGINRDYVQKQIYIYLKKCYLFMCILIQSWDLSPYPHTKE